MTFIRSNLEYYCVTVASCCSLNTVDLSNYCAVLGGNDGDVVYVYIPCCCDCHVLSRHCFGNCRFPACEGVANLCGICGSCDCCTVVLCDLFVFLTVNDECDCILVYIPCCNVVYVTCYCSGPLGCPALECVSLKCGIVDRGCCCVGEVCPCILLCTVFVYYVNCEALVCEYFNVCNAVCVCYCRLGYYKQLLAVELFSIACIKCPACTVLLVVCCAACIYKSECEVFSCIVVFPFGEVVFLIVLCFKRLNVRCQICNFKIHVELAVLFIHLAYCICALDQLVDRILLGVCCCLVCTVCVTYPDSLACYL